MTQPTQWACAAAMEHPHLFHRPNSSRPASCDVPNNHAPRPHRHQPAAVRGERKLLHTHRVLLQKHHQAAALHVPHCNISIAT